MDNEILKGCTGGGRWFILDPEEQFEVYDDLRKEHNFDNDLIEVLVHGEDYLGENGH